MDPRVNPAVNLSDFTFRSESGTAEDVDQLEDMTTPEEMYGGVIGHREPGAVAEPVVEQETVEE